MPRDIIRSSTQQGTDQIDELFTEYLRTRDLTTRNRLVELHLPIAERCARRYVNRGEPMADLIQVARLALVHAVERFDPDRGARFEAFALPTILGELRHHFRDRCWVISVPRRAKDLRSQVFRASERIGQQLGRQATKEEIAEVLDVTPERVATTLETNRHYRAASWESLLEGSDHVAAAGAVRDSTAENSTDRSANRVDIERSIAELDERLQQIVVWRFYEECTQREIGNRLGVGQVQVSRLLARALVQLRKQLDQTRSEPRGDDADQTVDSIADRHAEVDRVPA